jgi:hypothetical protein
MVTVITRTMGVGMPFTRVGEYCHRRTASSAASLRSGGPLSTLAC